MIKLKIEGFLNKNRASGLRVQKPAGFKTLRTGPISKSF